MPMLAESDGRILSEEESKQIADEVRTAYHTLFFAEKKWMTRWCGIPIAKNPLDLWIYQEIIAYLKPEAIVETGTFCGGSALYMAMILDLLGQGTIITVDNREPAEFECRAVHPRICYLQGDSADSSIVADIARRVAGKRTMVILDSDHTRNHVLKELDAYAPLVSHNHYLIVEDTNLNGHPVGPTGGPGPWEAVDEWLPKHPEFGCDPRPEVFGLTFNPGGFLLKIA